MNRADESKTTASRRIPLKHIDQIKANVRTMTKLQVKIRNDFKLDGLFEVAGESPVHIAKICKTDNERLYGVNVKVGDYIMTINERNVSRASAKSVKKIIRSSNVLTMTLCRPDASAIQRLHNPISSMNENNNNSNNNNNTVTTSAGVSHNQKRGSKLNWLLSGLFSSFRQTQSDTLVNSKLETTKSLIASCIKPAAEKPKTATTSMMVNPHKQALDESIDYGYCSIPRTNSIPNTKSLASDFGSSSAASSSSSIAVDSIKPAAAVATTARRHHVVVKFKSECDYFLAQIQQAIDVYVRPSIVLNILSISECLALYQNIEKLIPVTRFMQNVLCNSLEDCGDNLPNSDLLKIVFGSFKTYLLGLPSAINLLGELSESNQNFVDFINNIKDNCEFKILDLLFMPLNFVQLMVEFLRNMQTMSLSKSGDAESNKSRFGDLMIDLYECSLTTHRALENIFARDDQDQTSREVDDELFSQLSLSSHESVVSLAECGLEKVAVKVHRGSDGDDRWVDGYFWINKMKIEFVESELGVQQISNICGVRSARHARILYIKMLNVDESPSSSSVSTEISLGVKFESECIRDYLYEKMISKYF